MDNLRPKLRIKNELGRALLAEFVGTALLLLFVNCLVAQHILPNPKLNEFFGVVVGVGLAVTFGVAVSARISGGHINPAVSLMFLTMKQMAPVRFIAYVVAQTLGAFVGAALAYLVYYDAINAYDGGVRAARGVQGTAGIFVSYPSAHLGNLNGLVDQIVGTGVFCFLVAHIVDKRNSYPTWIQPILVGLGISTVGIAFGYNCGFPCNPARDIGPRLFSFIIYGGDVFDNWFWVPLVGPMIGGLLGGWLYMLLIGFHTPQDVEERYVVLTGNQELKPVSGKEGIDYGHYSDTAPLNSSP